MIDTIQRLVDEMAQELTHILAVAVVTVDDGMSIAQATRREGLDVAAASAYLASIVKSNSKAISLLADNEVIDDILITTDQFHFIIRHMQGQSFFLFLMTSKDEWLAKARMVIKKYEPQFGGLGAELDNLQ